MAAAIAALIAAGAAPEAATRRVGLFGSEAQAAGDGAAAEAAHAVLHEGALTLEDYWVRRGARAWFDLDPAFPALDAGRRGHGPAAGLVSRRSAKARSTIAGRFATTPFHICGDTAPGA